MSDDQVSDEEDFLGLLCRRDMKTEDDQSFVIKKLYTPATVVRSKECKYTPKDTRRGVSSRITNLADLLYLLFSI